MTDLEKVKKGLSTCREQDNPPGYIVVPCEGHCPYYKNGCARQLKEDALELLEEQQKLIDDIMQRRANNGAFD